MSDKELTYKYKVSIKNEHGYTVAIIYDNDIDFDIYKSGKQNDISQATFAFYNLSEKTRKRLNVSINLESVDTSINQFSILSFELNINSEKSDIFIGEIIEAGTKRVNNNLVTNIICQSGIRLYDKRTSVKLSKGQKIIEMYKLITQHTNIQSDISGLKNVNNTLDFSKVYEGAPMDLLNQENIISYVDNNKLVSLRATDTINPPYYDITIDGNTNLLETPLIKGLFIEVSTLPSVSIRLCQPITLKSIFSPQHNGTYKVFTISYKGEISQTMQSDITMNLELIKLADLKE